MIPPIIVIIPKNFPQPFSWEKYGINYVFQQDNSSIHIAKLTKDWFSANNIDIMMWPAKSPDLNPIENL